MEDVVYFFRGDDLFQTYVINFALIFAFTILVFWPKQQRKELSFLRFLPKEGYNVLIGVAYGLIGIFYGSMALDALNGVLYNSRIIFVIYSGIIGGPMAMFLSGFIMTFGRLLLFPPTELTSLMTINFLILLVGLTYFATIYRVRFDNIKIYLYFSMLEISLVLLFHYNFSYRGLYFIGTMLLFTFVTFWAIYWVLSQSQAASEQARQAMALQQIDYLTKLPNNFAIEARLNNALSKYASFSFLHIDIDEFRQLNYKYGYLIGDHVLEEFATLIKNYAKGKDIFIGRISGEEFCYVMKDTPPALAIYEANALRELVEKHSFGTNRGQFIQLSISIGISTMPDNGVVLEKLFNAADAALQATKKTTNNPVYHYNQFLKDIVYTKS